MFETWLPGRGGGSTHQRPAQARSSVRQKYPCPNCEHPPLCAHADVPSCRLRRLFTRMAGESSQAALLLAKQLKGKWKAVSLPPAAPGLALLLACGSLSARLCLLLILMPSYALYADLNKNPVEGFSAGLVDDANIFEWEIFIIGPTDTPYEGGFFKARLSFPKDYPNMPPKMKFISKFYHPNVHDDGSVCISILHPPGEDQWGYEDSSERWLPVHTVESILISVISMISSPNDESPANIDAAVRAFAIPATAARASALPPASVDHPASCSTGARAEKITGRPGWLSEGSGAMRTAVSGGVISEAVPAVALSGLRRGVSCGAT